jgi:LysR family transcriptional regulator, salicylic acid-responsive activator of bsdBCD
MNLRQLTYFRAVVEHGSLVAASEVLHVAQPPLSVAIKQLEAQWRVRLFDRVGRGLVLTDMGRAAYDRACQLLGAAAAVDQEMTAMGQGFSAHIRVGFTALGVEPIAGMIEQLRAEQPGVSFSLHQGEPKMLEDMIEQRELDFAISHLPVANPALQVHPLVALQLAVIAREAAAARLPSERPVDYADLAETPLVLLRRSSGAGIYERVRDTFQRAGVACNIVADASDLAVVYALIQRGVGVGLLPFRPGAELPTGLVASPFVTASASERLALVHGRGRGFLPAVQRAIELSRSRLSPTRIDF